MSNDKLTYQELVNQIAELKKQNEVFRLNSLSQNLKENREMELLIAKEKAENIEKYYNTILNKIGDPVFVKDNQSRFILVNDAFCEIFDLSRAEIIGKTLAEEISPDEMEIFLRIDRLVLADGVENINEEPLTVRGGQKRTISTRKSRFIDSCGEKFIVGIIRDISENKKAEKALRMSEAQFRGLFIQSHVGSALVGLDKCFIRCNEAFCHFLGFTEKEMIGKTITDFTHPEDRELGMNDMKRILEGEIESALVRKRYVCKDGTIVWGELSISVVRGEDNKPLYFLPVVHDITERVKAEKALKESEAQLKELNATKDRLFSIIAHDLRSPFISIIGFNELLKSKLKELDIEKTERYLGLINSSAKNTLVLLDNLLNWAKSQTGQINFDPQNVFLSSIIHKVIEQNNAVALIKNISIIQNHSDEIEVYTDENMVKVVLRNLLSNAIKFTNPGGQIYVSVISEQNHIEISVCDSGVGINDKTQENIFEVSADKASLGTSNEKGSGLGLILCKEFVEILGGNIWVESEVGKGSDFKFTLPLNK